MVSAERRSARTPSNRYFAGIDIFWIEIPRVLFSHLVLVLAANGLIVIAATVIVLTR